MIFPIIHNNGSGKENLLEDYQAAINAIEDAKKAVAKLLPHPRDYYVSPNKGDYENARIEHLARMQMLEVVRSEIEQIGMHVIENS